MPFNYTCKTCAQVGVSLYSGRQYCCQSCSSKDPSHHSRQSNSDKFWPKVDRSGGDNACWPWRRGLDEYGYGKFVWVDPESGKRHTMTASRVVFFLTHRYWPVFACHTCDNPLCCNPRHIYDGTPLQNMQDKVARGRARYARGEDASWSVLTENDVLAIRGRYASGGVTQRELAEQYGVSQSAISMVVRGKNWRAGPWPDA